MIYDDGSFDMLAAFLYVSKILLLNVLFFSNLQPKVQNIMFYKLNVIKMFMYKHVIAFPCIYS